MISIGYCGKLGLKFHSVKIVNISNLLISQDIVI